MSRHEEAAVATRVVKVDPHRPDPQVLEEAGRALARGELVVFPTETVYGLGADAGNARAVRRIFQVKGRPADNPLIVHVASSRQAMEVALPDPAGRWEELARRFWPGPLSLVLPCRGRLPAEVTANLPTVAVRVPRHAVALGLIRAAGRPVAAPSANRSGSPSPSRAEHVLADLQGLVEWVLDAGPTAVGLESTVLDLTTDPPTLLRPGGVTVEELEQVVGAVRLHPAVAGGAAGRRAGGAVEAGHAADEGDDRPRSPGMKYRHYAPTAPLWLVEGDPQAVARAVAEQVRRHPSARVGLWASRQTLELVRQELGGLPARVQAFCAGDRVHLGGVARRLFDGLRRLDAGGPDFILAEAMPEEGLGVAINNRLRRAAEGRVLRCGEQPARTGPHDR